MTTTHPRLCRGCPTPLPARSSPARQWCSQRCRKATLYGGTCAVCSGPTSGTNGRVAAPTVCRSCQQWSEAAIIDAIQRWAESHGGVPPTSADWADAGVDHPARTTVYSRIGWNEALLRAGFTPHRPGNPRWSEDAIITAIQRWAERHDGAPPTPTDWQSAAADRPTTTLVSRRIGWTDALVRAGFTPRDRPNEWSGQAIIAAIQRWAEQHDGVPPTFTDWQRAGDGHPSASIVSDRIGWGEALSRAGFAPHRRRWSDADIIDAIRRWAQRNGGVPPTTLDWDHAGPDHPTAGHVGCRIGWKEALARAGFAPHRRTWSSAEILNAITRWAERHDGMPPTKTDWHMAGADHPTTATVATRIGWDEAMARAGFTPRDRRKWTDAAIIAAIQRWAEEHEGVPPTSADWRHPGPGRPCYSTVTSSLGWREARSRAGFTHFRPRGRGPKWTDAAIIAAIQRWAEQHDGAPPTRTDWRRAGAGRPTYYTVNRTIGWVEALARAGFAPRDRRKETHLAAGAAGQPALPRTPAHDRPPAMSRRTCRKWSDTEIVAAIQDWAARHGGVPPTSTDWSRAGVDHPSASTIYLRMGFPEALARAGFPPYVRRQWSDDAIVEAIRRWAERHDGVPPRKADWARPGPDRPSALTVRRYVGWSEALRGAGFAPRDLGRRWSDAAIIAAIQRWAREHDGVPPTSIDWSRAGVGHPSMSTVYDRMGWNEAIARAGFTPDARRDWSDTEIIDAIRRWAARNGGVLPISTDWSRAGADHPSASTVNSRMGWNEAIVCAGFTPHTRRRWSDTEIIDAIRRWAARNGGAPPTSIDWHLVGADHPSANTVRNRVGWKQALLRAGFAPLGRPTRTARAVAA